MAVNDLDLGRYRLGWTDKVEYVFEPKKGMNEDVVNQISQIKCEPEWMTTFRLKAYSHFERKPMVVVRQEHAVTSTSRTSSTT